jgi:hypothetical protein
VQGVLKRAFVVRELFPFPLEPGPEGTYWAAETEQRSAAVNRKTYGGRNRTEAGAAAQAILMTSPEPSGGAVTATSFERTLSDPREPVLPVFADVSMNAYPTIPLEHPKPEMEPSAKPFEMKST